jgi:type II secretory pathway pseudopilin PulG
MRINRSTITNRSASKQKGYLLLAVMLLITLMLIAMAVAAPRIAYQIQRQKEEELVNRGKQYAVAIKKFYHKNGTYPVSLDQLENTNHQRYLRHRYKDPMTSTGEWTLIHVGEAQISMPTPAGGAAGPQAPGQAGSLTTNFPSTTSGLNSSTPTSPGGLNSGGLNAGGVNQGGFNQGGLNQGGLNQGGLNSGGVGGGLNSGGLTGSTPVGGPQGGGQMGTLQTSNIGSGLGGNAQGGGPIIGVASTSKRKGIKEFNGSSEYNTWLFVYDPRLEQGKVSGGGVTVGAPRGATPANGAVPAGVVTAPPQNPAAGSPTMQPGMPTTTPSPSPGFGSPTTPPSPGFGSPTPQQPAPSPTPQTTPQ